MSGKNAQYRKEKQWNSSFKQTKKRVYRKYSERSK